MLKNLLLLVCLFLCALPALAATPQQQLNFKLSTKKANYLVGEPIDLTYTLTNQLNTVINGRFELRSTLNNTQVLYRNHAGSEFTPLNNLASTSAEALVTASFESLTPNDSRITTERFVFDSNKNNLILSEPGVYEFQVKCQTLSSGGSIELLSNTIQVTVNSLPGAEQRAFQSWNDVSLLKFIQNRATDEAQQSIGFNRAQAFLQNYPASVYTDAVKVAVTKYLQSKTDLSASEKSLLNSLVRHKE